MKVAIVLCIFGTLFLVCHSSPVPVAAGAKTTEVVTPTDDKKDVAKASGRQATNDIAPSPDDDDDDDDDDEEDEDDVLGDLVGDDDDEEDDDEDDSPQGQAAPSSDDDDDDDEDDEGDDDDDDEEGLEGFFDDFAGEDADDDDDDDDDDDVTNQVVSQAIVPAAAAAVVPGPDAVSDGSGIDTKVDVQSLNEDNGVPSASIGSAEKGHGAGLGVGHHHHHSHLVQFGHHKGSGSSSSSGSEEGDDDIVVEDYIDTERSLKSLDEESMSQKDIFQGKHNAFIDAIFTRINNMLSDSYDPLNVQLSGRSKHFKGKSNDGKQQRTKNNRRSKKTKGRKPTATTEQTEADDEEKLNSVDDSRVQVASSVAGELRANQPASSASIPLKKSTYSGNVAGFNSNSNGISSSKPLKSNTNKTKQSGLNNNKEQLEKAEATLYGLATLKRIGNVKIITDPEGKNSTIKTKFTLGPLKLKVEKSFKRGSVRSVKSATAVTNEMVGRMKFRVLDNSATLMSIKVQQPKQVEVESKDNHDRTRKFVWEKTPQLAHLVSENLKLAIESAFVPEPPQVVRL